MDSIPNTKTSGLFPVIAALSGNIVIAIIKFIGFAMSGSGALFSEAIHSLADTLNQILLLIGIKLSSKQADDRYSYGYGLERFLWALISACAVFFLGAGVTIYHGLLTLRSGEMPHIGVTTFVILLVSFLVESTTFILAFRELNARNHGMSTKRMLREGDPATIAVLYEDGVAVLGVAVAFVSIALSSITGNPVWDSIGSIIIGILLGVVAVLLIQKNRSYLIGRNIPDDVRDMIIAIMEADPTIEKVIDFKSSILDVGEYQVKCEVEFNGPALMKEIMENTSIRDEYDGVRDDYQEFIRFLVRSVGRVPRMIGTSIDQLELRIQEEIPEVKHIDIEIN
jgi:zinc transporter 9